MDWSRGRDRSTRARRALHGAEVALAFAAGVESFALVAVALAVFDSGLFAVAFGAACIAAVIAIARRWGVANAVPSALAALLAYDWYQFPPTHPEEFPSTGNLANLVVYLAVRLTTRGRAGRTSPRVGPARPTAHRPAHSQSGRRPTRAVATARFRAAGISAAAMNGRPITKIHRQPRLSTSQPPTNGLTTAAIPLKAAQVPIALPRSSGATAAMITASDAGVSSAPNTPLSPRAAISASTVGARAQAADAGCAQDEQTPLAEDVSERAADQDKRAQHQQIRVDDPLLALQTATQVAADRRQSDADDRRVEERHERTERRGCERESLVADVHRRTLRLSTRRSVGSLRRDRARGWPCR
jgi:hypothetical protein